MVGIGHDGKEEGEQNKTEDGIICLRREHGIISLLIHLVFLCLLQGGALKEVILWGERW